jgi:hypothetical protein
MAARYDYSHAVVMKELITDEHAKHFDINIKPSYRGKKARAIFADFMCLVIDDLIENGGTFMSPNKVPIWIFIKEQNKISQKRILSNISKIYTEVDLMKSNGKFYEFVLRQSSIPGRFRSIRIGHSKYKKLIKAVNNGARYTSSI